MRFFEFQLALCYLRSFKRSSHTRKGGGFLSFISFIAVIGIAISIWALIVVVSVMNGFQREVRENMLGVVSHATVSSYTGIANWHEVSNILNQIPEIKAHAPFIEKQALVTNHGIVHPVAVRGIVPDMEQKVANVLRELKIGDLNVIKTGSFKVIIGKDLARIIGAYVGDTFTLIAPQGNFTPLGVVPRMRKFEVAGIFQANLYEFDAGMILIDLEDAKKIFQTEEIDGIRLQFDDVLKANYYVHNINNQLPPPLVARDWSASHRTYFRAVQIEKRIMFLILSIIIAVASINVINQQMMLINEKVGDIAILRTIGANRSSIIRIFLIQGFLLSALGILIGVISGIISALNVEVIVRTIEGIFNVKFLSPEVYQIPEIPSELKLYDVIITVVTALIITSLATLYPSFRAAKTLPVEVLRYE